MSSTDRQNRLLVAEDWQRIYQTFRNADFRNYDFDTLRRTMISYLRENYPEDFNDYIESSEYLALIDLIAYLGQNLSFRIDLNARENFLELAERRESILRLARLLSYNPKRNQSANGFLKIESVKTTEDIFDSNNRNLSNQTILWDDPSNNNWYEQFIKVLNAAMIDVSPFGKPLSSDDVNGVPTEQYRLNATNTNVPVYSFSKTINGRSLPFEITSSKIENGEIVEEPPLQGNSLAFLYRDDGQGPSSSNSGFFAHFRQGRLDTGEFTIDNPTTNQTINIETDNINNSDVWLYGLDSNGFESELWTKVQSLEGNNIVYNSLDKNIRNIYNVLTKANDRIDLVFSDGVFGNLPRGQFRIYYRTGANSQFSISPKNIRNVSIRVDYRSKKGTVETLNIGFELKYTVDNASRSETNESIKANAPASYYTQNRLITAEDYNVGPLAVSQEIVKTKSVNRISSGISRFFDLKDSTGKYSNTNIFADDGVIYKRYKTQVTNFSFDNKTEIENVIYNQITPFIKERTLLNFYYDQFRNVLVSDLQSTWRQVTSDTNRSTGYFYDGSITGTTLYYKLGSFTSSNLKFIEPGALLKFVAPTGKYFDKDKNLKDGVPIEKGSTTYIWVKAVNVSADGTANNEGILESGLGPVVLNDNIPDGAILSSIRPKLTTTISNDIVVRMINLAFAYRTFGLRYDVESRQWRVILESNLDKFSDFSIAKTGDNSNQQLDASWLMLFETDGEKYTVTVRNLEYIFESAKEVRFFYDSVNKIYDSKTGKIVKDVIKVLSINTQPGNTAPFTTNWDWQVTKEFRDAEGYVDSRKIQVSFFDSDDDGVIDDPEIFEHIVGPDVVNDNKYVFSEKYITLDGTEDYRFISKDNLNIKIFGNEATVTLQDSQIENGQLFYFTDTNLFKNRDTVNSRWILNTNYKAYIGREQLQFQYIHSADYNERIDPSVSNIIDTYLLTRSYDLQYRQWLSGAVDQKPLPPSSDELFFNYGKDINSVKSLSDEIIYHPVKYKVLFGSKASTNLQATFKIVKNEELVLNDNELKSEMITAINQFFALENWDFGEKFYFTELATYIMNQMLPKLSSIVIVPNDGNSAYGSLQEVRSESDEIFISGATVDDVEIISSITASRLKASGNVVTADSTVESGVQSSSLSVTDNIGGFTY